MALKTGKLRTMKFSAKKQTAVGTPATEDANSAIAIHEGNGVEYNLERDLIEDRFITGSFSKTAPQPGMYSDDIGATVNTMLRGKGTLSKPDYSVFLESIMGSESQNTDGTVDALSTTTTILIKTGGDPDVGQLVYFPDQLHVARVIAVTAGTSFDLDPMTALPATPSEDDDFICGTNWQLTSEDHPYFTVWSYFDGPKKVQYDDNKCTSATFTLEVGQVVPVEFVCQALSYTLSYDSQSVTPNYDLNTVPLTCLGITLNTTYQATATGTPTQTETILSDPPFDVEIGDKIRIDVGSGVYETVAISAVSGNAGSNITLTHASVSVAASSGDTVYVIRSQCTRTAGATMEITIEAENEAEQCMTDDFGKTGLEMVDRNITITRSPYFKSWEQFLLRDEVVGAGIMVSLGSDLDNIVSMYVSNAINTEVSLTSDPLMLVETTSMATIDDTLGNDDEFVIAAF